jgi:hypothetical protein
MDISRANSGSPPEVYVDPKTGGVYADKEFKHLCRCITPRESTEPPAKKEDSGPAHFAPGTR